jgi:hypothetical protein
MGKPMFIDGSRVDQVLMNLSSYLPVGTEVGTEVGSKPETKDGYETLKVYYPRSKSLDTLLKPVNPDPSLSFLVENI